ncbi:NYN domain-containing protein [Bacillus fonticola]|uniref:NYN domain-containing protein n=1 Tax=Bacillus fonticola TaxID=2728853 RepID=UPI001D147C04|nr:NYN domain-containing protein [Bacillus fonticola]
MAKEKEEILLVDGYNIIGAWPTLRSLKEKGLEESRNELIQQMTEYQAYTGQRVMIVFDAYGVKGLERKIRSGRVDVLFTREKETADERIEKLAVELQSIRTQVYVATSDFTEQWSVFGQGALRKSARELLREVETIQGGIRKSVERTQRSRPQSKIQLSNEVAEIFEKWRRGDR